jgi:hypothetical protein
MRQLYCYGILVYNVYADRINLNNYQRFPPSATILSAFVASVVGLYAGGNISTFMSALWAWHKIYLRPWQGHSSQLNRLVTGAAHLVPASSKRMKTAPVLMSLLDTILATLDWRNDSVDAVVCAFCLIAFYSMVQTGQLVPEYLTKYMVEPRCWPKRTDLLERQNRFGDETTVLFLPHTNSAGYTGEDIFWSALPCIGDARPNMALANHFCLNDPPPDTHSFVY